MKKFIKLLLIIIFLVFILFDYSSAESWKKVVNMGFGNPRNAYAWSMASFKGKLYVGTLNPFGGAQIWCSDNGNEKTWQKTNFPTISRNLGVRCMYADGDKALYACTTNNLGGQILKTTDGKTWNIIVSNGFGNMMNYTIRCMVRFKDYLYAGTGCGSAKLYRTKDGYTWENVKANPSFESTKVRNPYGLLPVTNNSMIGELAVFNGYLYAFTWTKDADPRTTLLSPGNLNFPENYEEMHKFFLFPAPGAFEVWRSNDGKNWETVVGKNDPYGNGLGFSLHDPDNLNNDMVTSVTVFKDKLYLGTAHDFARTSIWRTAEGTKWEKVIDFYKLGEEYNFYVWRLREFDGKLFVGTANFGLAKKSGVTGAQIWASDSGDAGTFYNVVHNGLDGETALALMINIPKNYGIRSLVVHNDALFIGTATMFDVPLIQSSQSENSAGDGIRVGCEIWRMIP